MPIDDPAHNLPGNNPPAGDMPVRPRTAAEYGAPDHSPREEAEIIRLHAPIVKRIATRLLGRLPETVLLDDLIQAGLIAVLRAVRRGSVSADGIPLPVLHRIISNAMIDEARRGTWAPVRTVRLAKSAGRAMRLTRQRLGRDGTDEEVAATLALPLTEYHALLTEIAGIRLLDLDTFGEGDQQLRADDDQHAILDKNRLLKALTEAIAALPERENTIVSLYYEHELNMEEVGRVLDIDKSTVCRAHGRALLKLRDALGDWGAGAPAPQRRPGG
ncbi:MAG TPA: sigma-70 family RNA polymerase sigma factor [Stellaceae bacterium]|nr:sigma-70 family RNA polymerase sigma factor [Stellaceae bacterium]